MSVIFMPIPHNMYCARCDRSFGTMNAEAHVCDPCAEGAPVGREPHAKYCHECRAPFDTWDSTEHLCHRCQREYLRETFGEVEC